MKPSKVDLIADVLFGVLVLSAIVSMVVVGTLFGLAFGAGICLTYMVHVGWKMGRFDPDWMTRREDVERVAEEAASEAASEATKEVENEIEEMVDNAVKGKS